MRAVNLLPPSQRAHRAGGQPGSAYVVLGVLGALLVAVLMYVLATNQLTSKQDELAKVKRDTAAAEARAAALGDFDDFAQVKATREASVKQLAEARLDWERLMRELSRLLPEDVFVSSLDASAASAGQDGAVAAGGPTMKLTGCAPSQPGVATTMVRLRRLHRARDVKLASSDRAGGDGGGEGGEGEAAAGGGCAKGYGFALTVEFDPASGSAAPGKVPAHLGGGA